MPTENDNPVVYFDPKTKKVYDSFQVHSPKFSETVLDRLHTRVLSYKDKNTIIDVPEFYDVPIEVYKRLQLEYDAFGSSSEKLWDFYESYPELLYMTHIERIDWSPVSKDIYHTKEHYITTNKERTKLLNALKKKFYSKDYRTTVNYQKGYKQAYDMKPPKSRDKNYMLGYKEGQERLPKLYMYYRKRLRGGKRSDNLYRREVKYKKLTTPAIRDSIASIIDRIQDTLDYYYVVAERKSEKGPGLEYRTIVGRVDK